MYGLLFLFYVTFMAKKKKGIPFWVWIAGAAAALIAVGVNVSQKIYVKRTRVKIPNINFNTVTVRLLMDVVNNSGVSVPIDSITGNLLYGQEVISAVDLFTSVVIQSHGMSTVQLDLTIPIKQLSDQIINAIHKGTWYRYTYFEGFVVSKGIRFPVRTNIQLL